MVVYIREAHPAGPDQTSATAGWKKVNDLVYHQPATFQERRKLAETACTFWQLPMPAVVDTITPSVGDIYDAWPNRIYVIDRDGRIAFRGPKGPGGVRPREGEAVLQRLLGKPAGGFVTPEDSGGLVRPGASRAPPSSGR
jgi:hypothetical protein